MPSESLGTPPGAPHGIFLFRSTFLSPQKLAKIVILTLILSNWSTQTLNVFACIQIWKFICKIT